MRILLLVLIGSFTSGCGLFTGNPYEVVLDTSLLTDDYSTLEKWRLSREIVKAIDTITTRLAFEYRDTLFVYVFDSGMNEGSPDKIHLERNSADDPNLILHEVTHAITPLEATGFYSEGVAMAMPLMNQPRSVQARHLRRFIGEERERYIPIDFLMQNDSLFVKQHSKETGVSYVEAGSFIAYLADCYGWEKIQELLHGRIKDYVAVFGKSLPYLEREWLETLVPSPSIDTTTIDLR